jgi:hypothetical protein
MRPRSEHDLNMHQLRVRGQQGEQEERRDRDLEMGEPSRESLGVSWGIFRFLVGRMGGGLARGVIEGSGERGWWEC